MFKTVLFETLLEYEHQNKVSHVENHSTAIGDLKEVLNIENWIQSFRIGSRI